MVDGAPGDEVDDVDRIVGAWRRERPDLDVEPLAVFSRISRLARQLDLARRHAFAAQHLEVGAFDVLAALRRSGEPYELTPGRLVAETLVSSGTMTNRIDRLVARGLVARAHSPQDRRQVLVRLTPEGRDMVDAAITDLLARERALLAGLDDAERDALARLLRRLAEPFGVWVPALALAVERPGVG
jgi:DNA-binding MarR family transcriptional regulator